MKKTYPDIHFTCSHKWWLSSSGDGLWREQITRFEPCTSLPVSPMSGFSTQLPCCTEMTTYSQLLCREARETHILGWKFLQSLWSKGSLKWIHWRSSNHVLSHFVTGRKVEGLISYLSLLRSPLRTTHNTNYTSQFELQLKPFTNESPSTRKPSWQWNTVLSGCSCDYSMCLAYLHNKTF